jgi:hypothetical protein
MIHTDSMFPFDNLSLGSKILVTHKIGSQRGSFALDISRCDCGKLVCYTIWVLFSFVQAMKFIANCKWIWSHLKHRLALAVLIPTPNGDLVASLTPKPLWIKVSKCEVSLFPLTSLPSEQSLPPRVTTHEW